MKFSTDTLSGGFEAYLRSDRIGRWAARASSADESWWFLDAMLSDRDAIECPILQREIEADVAIVGGGYTGLWAALSIKEAEPDLSVVLLERDVCGSGASGKNGGKVHGYWSSLPHLASMVGSADAWQMARLGTRAQDAIRAYVKGCGRDVWWREDGGLKVSAAPVQDAKIESLISSMQRLGASSMARRLSANEVRQRCESLAFRAGIFYPEEATVHPARLARALRHPARQRGVQIFERTPMTDIVPGPVNRVVTSGGDVLAQEVILATNVDLLKFKLLSGRFMAFSSYALMTEPVADQLERLNWTTDCSLTDARSFLHYFRKTVDGRVLMGSGSGPIAYGANIESDSFLNDRESFTRAKRGVQRFLPSIAQVPVSAAWSGAIDVSSDRLPFAGTISGSRIHYAFGFSGHGVNPTYVLGRCLASLTLGIQDDWSLSPFCTRKLPWLPPEPFRYIGGAVIRKAIVACEDAGDNGHVAPLHSRFVAALPEKLKLKIGSR